MHSDTTPRAPSEDSPPASRLELEAVLNEPIRRIHSSFFYKLTLLPVALALVLLLMTYVGLVAAWAWGLYRYSVYALRMVLSSPVQDEGDRLFAALLFLTPELVGLIVLFFMIKPLLARPPRPIPPRTLKPADEPVLFAFVAKLCAVVGAPVPGRIQVDCQVNAGASSGGGAWSILRRNLTLTLGLPLVAGMTLRQLAGVLAHELGHVSQGSAMLLHYVIVSTNYWFARVVYRRDAWDVFLEMASRRGDVHWRVIFYVSRLFIWLTRRVLWVLMHLGHLVSFFLSRQMEYDADRYEARVIGSDAFEQGMVRLHLLELAWQKTQEDLNAAMEERRLGEDLPALIAANAEAIPPETQRQFIERVMRERVGWCDTHPSSRERIERAAREASGGIFHDERPAAELFASFPELCKTVTMDFYAKALGPAVGRSRLVPTPELLGGRQAMEESFDSAASFFFGCLDPDRPLRIEPADLDLEDDPRELARELQRSRDRLAALGAKVHESFMEFQEGWRLGLLAFIGGEAVAVRLAFRTGEVKIKTAEEARALQEKSGALRDEADLMLLAAEDALRRRLLAALRLLHTPQLRQRLVGAPRLLAQAERVVAALNCYQMVGEAIEELRRTRALLEFLVSQSKGPAANVRLTEKMIATSKTIVRLMTRIHGAMRLVQYPFPHGTGDITLGHYVMEIPADPKSLADTGFKSEMMLTRLNKLFYRAAGELGRTAEQVEQALGLPPLSQPTVVMEKAGK